MKSNDELGVPVMELERVDVPSPGDPEWVLVRDVNWRIHAGECWFLGGPPGSGKSSVLSVAAGLVRPTRGRLQLFGAPLSELTEAEQLARRARVGVVFGGGGRLFTHLTVAENVALPLLYHAGNRAAPVGARAEEVLQGLGLARYAGRLARDLPRRIAQRVGLARALAMEPDVLVLDDPTAGLGHDDSAWWLEFAHHQTRPEAPPTLVVASTGLEPWLAVAGHFAVVENRAWRIMESAAAMEPWLRPAAAD